MNINILDLIEASGGDMRGVLACHPGTGEAFVAANVRRESNRQQIRFMPPGPPGSTVCDGYDDDGYPINERNRTPEEQAEADAAYVRALAHWNRTCGVAYVDGCPTYTIDLRTDSGATMRAVGAGDGRWFVTETTAPLQTTKAPPLREEQRG